jgi:hypothetical protein
MSLFLLVEKQMESSLLCHDVDYFPAILEIQNHPWLIRKH